MSRLFHPVFYLFYRSISVLLAAIVIVYSVIQASQGESSLFQLIARIIFAGLWALMLWSCPDLISGEWEKKLSPNLRALESRRVALFIMIISLLFGGFGIFIIAFFATVFLFPALFQYSILIAAFAVVLIAFPMAVGLVRIFLQMHYVSHSAM